VLALFLSLWRGHTGTAIDSIESFYGVVEVDGVYVSAGLIWISKDKLKTYIKIFKAHRNLTNKNQKNL